MTFDAEALAAQLALLDPDELARPFSEQDQDVIRAQCMDVLGCVPHEEALPEVEPEPKSPHWRDGEH